MALVHTRVATVKPRHNERTFGDMIDTPHRRCADLGASVFRDGCLTTRDEWPEMALAVPNSLCK